MSFEFNSREIENLDVSIETDIIKALKWCDAANVLKSSKRKNGKILFSK